MWAPGYVQARSRYQQDMSLSLKMRELFHRIPTYSVKQDRITTYLWKKIFWKPICKHTWTDKTKTLRPRRGLPFLSWLMWVTISSSPVTALALLHSSYFLGKNSKQTHQIASHSGSIQFRTDCLYFFEHVPKSAKISPNPIEAPLKSLLPHGVRSLLLQQA